MHDGRHVMAMLLARILGSLARMTLPRMQHNLLYLQTVGRIVHCVSEAIASLQLA